MRYQLGLVSLLMLSLSASAGSHRRQAPATPSAPRPLLYVLSEQEKSQRIGGRLLYMDPQTQARITKRNLEICQSPDDAWIAQYAACVNSAIEEKQFKQIGPAMNLGRYEASSDIVYCPSPLNQCFPKRQETKHIILHTTEGATEGALVELRNRGKANFVVDRDGTVYQTVDVYRIANHAGVSMWDGRFDVSTFSIGIEIVGYHDLPPTSEQLTAIRDLVWDLRKAYKIPRKNVLTHSMVAHEGLDREKIWGWRGRKTCATNLVSDEIWGILGLGPRPTEDPDVAAGRLDPGNMKQFSKIFPEHAAKLGYPKNPDQPSPGK